jgi:hypothetical protein
VFDLEFRLVGCLARPHGGSLSSHLKLWFVFSQLNVTLRARMSGFLHVIHAEGDKAARPTSKEAKNQCSYHATWTSFTVSHGRNGCSTLIAIYIHRFWAKMSRHDFEIVTQLLKKWFSQMWNEITISTYLSKSVGTLSYWHCSLVCNIFEVSLGL